MCYHSKFLVFCLGQKGINLTKNCVKTMLKLAPPSNIKKIHGFMGIVNFIKNHIPNQTTIIEATTMLTKKDTPFK